MAIYHLQTPISENEIRKIRINDIVFITGTIFTARDEAHERALEFKEKSMPMPLDTHGLAVFHCGPIVRKVDEKWELVAAGPTTSTRMEMFQDKFIKAFNIRVVIGKGGMGTRTAEAMKQNGAIYGAFTGGAAVLAAKAITRIIDVAWLDFGMPEALWIMEVEHFGPLIVAIDSTGANLFEQISVKANQNRDRAYRLLGLT